MMHSRHAARLRRLGRFARSVLARFAADRGPSLAASLTYTTLLALVPLLAVGLAVMTAFPAFEDFQRATEAFFHDNLLPPRVGDTVVRHLREFSAGAARLTVLGLAVLAVSALLMLNTIESAFNGIWRVRRTRPVVVRIVVYGGVVTLGPILVGASLTTTSYLVTASLGLAESVPGLQEALLTAGQFVLTGTAFTLLYLVVPYRRVAFAHAALGGALTALLFEAMNRAFAVYIGHMSSYTLVYGAFAAGPLFLVWIYLCWAVTLLGAVLTSMLPDYAHAAWTRSAPAAPALPDLLEVLRVLAAGRSRAAGPTAFRVAASARLPLDRAEPVLDALARGGWAAQTADGRWLLACDPEVVTAAQVYESMARSSTTRVERAPALDRLLAQTTRHVHAALDVPLQALADDADRAAADAEAVPAGESEGG
jgi:membrane protein